MGLLAKLARLGLIHCDFNEFNLFVSTDDEERVTLIDFPQMISTSHANAEELFDRDVHGVVKFFERKFGGVEEAERVINGCYPSLRDILGSAAEDADEEGERPIDRQLRASGWVKEHQRDLQQWFLTEKSGSDSGSGSGSGSGSSDGDSDDDESLDCSSSEDGAHEGVGERERESESDDDDDDDDASPAASSPSRSSSAASSLEEAFAKSATITTTADNSKKLQAHVQKKVADQRKLEAKRKFVVKASRNAMKSKNKGKRKGEATGNKPMSAADCW